MFKTKIRKPGVFFVVNSPKIYRDVAGVRGHFIAQEIARNNTGKLDINRSATSRTISLVILVRMFLNKSVCVHINNVNFVWRGSVLDWLDHEYFVQRQQYIEPGSHLFAVYRERLGFFFRLTHDIFLH